jgi:hypothetical protein
VSTVDRCFLVYATNLSQLRSLDRVEGDEYYQLETRKYVEVTSRRLYKTLLHSSEFGEEYKRLLGSPFLVITERKHRIIIYYAYSS